MSSFISVQIRIWNEMDQSINPVANKKMLEPS